MSRHKTGSFRTSSLLFLTLAIAHVLHVGVTVAQQPTGSFADQLVPPELIMQHGVEIQLSNKQQQELAAIVNELDPKIRDLQQGVTDANRKLVELLDRNLVDETDAAKHLTAFLSAEQKAKELQFTALIRVRNVLTRRQRAFLATKMNQARGVVKNATQKRLRSKVTQIQKEIQSRVSEGTPPLEAAKIMESFSQAMSSGDLQEAEAVLDRVMKMLAIQPSATSKTPNAPDSGKKLPEAPKMVARLGKQKALSFSEVKRSVAGLYEKDVPWRKIQWETCLLKGLKRSRDERKPLVLWVFIDRPIDDERC